MLVVVVNSAVGVWQELRADRAVEALAAMTVPTSRVIRDGVEHEITSTEIVPGDLVLLGEGDVVPADGTEEATLWAGTVMVHGRGRMVVTRTGATSTLGRIAGMLDSRPPPTPLLRRRHSVAERRHQRRHEPAATRVLAKVGPTAPPAYGADPNE
jgi:P-type Ca2+ transporter type 2C